VAVAVAGLVDLGHQAGERAHPGEVGEAVEVAKTAQDASGQGHAPARGRHDDAVRVSLVVEAFNAGIQLGDLVPEGADEPDLARLFPVAHHDGLQPTQHGRFSACPRRPALEGRVAGGSLTPRLSQIPA